MALEHYDENLVAEVRRLAPDQGDDVVEDLVSEIVWSSDWLAELSTNTEKRAKDRGIRTDAVWNQAWYKPYEQNPDKVRTAFFEQRGTGLAGVIEASIKEDFDLGEPPPQKLEDAAAIVLLRLGSWKSWYPELQDRLVERVEDDRAWDEWSGK